MWSEKKDSLYEELCRMLQELALGKTHAQALQGFAERAPTELVREFVSNVIQSERRGTPLVEVLTIQAEVARSQALPDGGEGGQPRRRALAAADHVLHGRHAHRHVRQPDREGLPGAAPVSAPAMQAATPPKPQKTQPTLFSLSVARLGDKATVYVFDQPTLAIGRGRECDLRLEHDGFSRRQVILQRSVTSTGSPRFRLIPQKTSNPTYVNGQPLVEGAIKSGDVIAVADMRITFTRGKAEDEVVAARRRRKRALLMAATVVMVAAFVSTLISARSSVAADTRLTQPQNDLLRDTRGFLCAGTAECATRAREAYHTGKRFLSQSMSDLSYPYRAAVEFQRAMRFRDQSGKPLPEISDVDRYLTRRAAGSRPSSATASSASATPCSTTTCSAAPTSRHTWRASCPTRTIRIA